MAGIQGRVTVNEIDILEVNGDPGAGAGTPAPVGSLAIVDQGGVWQKVSAADASWVRVASTDDFYSLASLIEKPGTTWTETPAYLSNGEFNYIEYAKGGTRVLRVDFTYSSALDPLTETWQLYASDGVTVVRTATRTFTSSGNDPISASVVYA